MPLIYSTLLCKQLQSFLSNKCSLLQHIGIIRRLGFLPGPHFSSQSTWLETTDRGEILILGTRQREGKCPRPLQNLESPDCGVWRPVDLLPVDWTQVSTFFPAFPAGTGSKKTKEESPVIEVIKWIEGALCRLSREHATRWRFIYQSPYYQCITLPATWFNHLEANITYPCSRREEHSFSESPSLEAYSS